MAHLLMNSTREPRDHVLAKRVATATRLRSLQRAFGSIANPAKLKQHPTRSRYNDSTYLQNLAGCIVPGRFKKH